MQYHSQIYQKIDAFGFTIGNTIAKSIKKLILLAIVS